MRLWVNGSSSRPNMSHPAPSDQTADANINCAVSRPSGRSSGIWPFFPFLISHCVRIDTVTTESQRPRDDRYLSRRLFNLARLYKLRVHLCGSWWAPNLWHVWPPPCQTCNKSILCVCAWDGHTSNGFISINFQHSPLALCIVSSPTPRSTVVI